MSFASWLRRITSLSITLLVVLLPALVAGIGIDRPARGEEQKRIRAVLALSPDEGREPGSIPGRWFFRTTLPERLVELGPKSLDQEPERTQAVTYARFVGLLGMLLISCALYLTLASSRGQAVALLACIALATLPAVSVEGVVLRPEIPAAGTTLLALAVILAAQVLDRPLGRIADSTRHAIMAALAVGSGALVGLAAAFLPQAWYVARVPAIVLFLTTASLTILVPRLLRRGREVPLLAIGRRLVFWLATMLAWPAMCVLVLLVGYEGGTPGLSFSASEVGLMPAGTVGTVLAMALAVLGAASWIRTAGRQISLGARLTSTTVLMVYVVVELVQRSTCRPGDDALLSTVALAMPIGEGAAIVMRALIRAVAGRLR